MTLGLNHSSGTSRLKTPRCLLFLSVFTITFYSCDQPKEIKTEIILKTESVEIQNPEDIISLSDSLVKPILYSHISGLDLLPLEQKKDKFISALLPAILVVKRELQQQREKLIALLEKEAWLSTDSIFFNQLANQFKTRDPKQLRMALETHPNSLVLAQAAVESGWGNSRIFADANNLFGIWSYNSNEPRIASRVNRGADTVYLRKYDDISQSIESYFITLGRSRAYHDFRKARAKTDDVYALIPHLRLYSERREAYVAQLGTMIRFNGLRRYDSYRIDPDSFVEVEVNQ